MCAESKKSPLRIAEEEKMLKITDRDALEKLQLNDAAVFHFNLYLAVTWVYIVELLFA